MKRRHSSGFDWTPMEGKGRPHEIENIRFGDEPGLDSWILCRCDWTFTGPTPESVEKAYIDHRRSLGLTATGMQVGLVPWV